MRYAFLASLLLLAGCANGPGVAPPAPQLAKPAAHLMVAPVALAEVEPNSTDLFDDDTVCSAAYVKETGKLVGLQRYVRRVTKD